MVFRSINLSKEFREKVMKRIIILTALFLFCTKPTIFKAYCQGDSTVVVDSTFEVGFLIDVKSCVTSIGTKIIYDTTKILYVSHEVYGNFDSEMIALQNGEQGILAISFTQLGENPVSICNVDSLKLVKLVFYVKSSDFDEGSLSFTDNHVLYKGNELSNTAWENFK